MTSSKRSQLCFSVEPPSHRTLRFTEILDGRSSKIEIPRFAGAATLDTGNFRTKLPFA